MLDVSLLIDIDQGRNGGVELFGHSHTSLKQIQVAKQLQIGPQHRQLFRSLFAELSQNADLFLDDVFFGNPKSVVHGNHRLWLHKHRRSTAGASIHNSGNFSALLHFDGQHITILTKGIVGVGEVFAVGGEVVLHLASNAVVGASCFLT